MPEQIKVLREPLSLKEAKKIAKANKNRLSVVIELDLNDLIYMGEIDNMNEFADEKIIDSRATLSDISYRVVGCVPGKTGGHFASGSVLVEVNAELYLFDNE